MALPTIDSGFPKHVFSSAAPTSSSIASITTTGPSLMVAVLHIDNPGATPTVTSAGGLTWTERVHESAVGTASHWVSIWTAPSAGALSAVTITFSFTSGGAAMLDIYSVSGAAASPIGASATLDSNASASAPQVTVNAQAANSLIIGGFDNYQGAGTLTALANTTKDQSDATVDELTSGHASTLAAGNITVGGSAPNVANSCCVALEILGVSASGGGSGHVYRQQSTFHPNPVSRFRTRPAYSASSTAPIQYPQAVDGTLSISGALVNQTSKILAGSMASSGLLVKQTGKILAGALTSSGAVQKQVGKVLAGALTSSGLLVKQTGKVLSGALSSSGALVKQTAHALAGTLTSAGLLVKQTGKILAGTLTSSGAITAFKVALVSLAGTLTSSGTLTKRVGKNLAGTLTSAGTIVKRTATSMAGTLTSTGALLASKVSTATRKVFIWIFDD